MNINKRIERKLKIYSLILIIFIPLFHLIAQAEVELPSKPPTNENLKSSQEEEEISDWQARLELARVLSYLQKYEESLQEYQRLLQEHPESSIARIEMAKILFFMGRTDESLQQFSQVPSKDIDDKTWIVIADLNRKIKNYPRAEQIYSHYLEKFPEDDKVRLKLAELLSWQKRYRESVAQYHIILNHRPDDIQVRRRYAQVLTWMGEDKEAIKEWKKTLP